jgi:DNA-binding response OmpR family regulator
MLEGLNILIVEDEFVASKYLAEILKEIDFIKIESIHKAKNTKEAFDVVERYEIELIFMDINLGDSEDGIACAKRICKKQNTPIIFTTAYSDSQTILDASKTNIVGYLCKPFNLPAVKGVLSIAAKTIEEKKTKSDDKKVPLSGYRYDTKEKTIHKDGEIIKLSAKESMCLSVLYGSKNRFVSSEHICAYVWGEDGYDPKNSLRELLHRLRKKLPDLEIENIPTLGYTLKTKV